ncbi:LOW QUALITY PROTEIN: uncharacterized protein LOC115661624 [Syzygium oleosum]|uniref:LOW QUALITY PROTEIN: uncharacterized protein LOC115661624 n=1 Tax=Syzygium oleosum TaxID=219896 RepID=UPI0024BA9A44|nr:LOW QUALITY PROTEIN: uncharacterized protein LOC115661624 [Syzygium oleosum]
MTSLRPTNDVTSTVACFGSSLSRLRALRFSLQLCTSSSSSPLRFRELINTPRLKRFQPLFCFWNDSGGRRMSALIQKLARTAAPSSLKLFRQSGLNPRFHPAPALVPRRTVPGSPGPERSRDSSRVPGQGAHENAKSSRIPQLYPAFPFGSCANPDPVSSAALDGAEHAGGDDPWRVWADSVKKKRKRKMNKRKYKKLRKRLRRKAKS